MAARATVDVDGSPCCLIGNDHSWDLGLAALAAKNLALAAEGLDGCDGPLGGVECEAVGGVQDRVLLPVVERVGPAGFFREQDLRVCHAADLCVDDLRLVADERRNSDCRQDADDQDDHQQLDERESALGFVTRLQELHELSSSLPCCPPMRNYSFHEVRSQYTLDVLASHLYVCLSKCFGNEKTLISTKRKYYSIITNY